MKFHVGDLMSAPDDIGSDCDLVYTDPPWEDRMVSWFGTASAKAGGPRQSANINQILERFFDLCPSDVPVFVEYGVVGYEKVISRGISAGYNLCRIIEGIQTTRNPYVILQFNSDLPASASKPVGFEILDQVLWHHKPKHIFEPFAGLGKHAARMVRFGASVSMCELNPARAERAKRKLSGLGCVFD